MSTNMNIPFSIPALNRRDFLYGLTSSLGSLAMTDLMAQDAVSGKWSKKTNASSKSQKCHYAFYGGRSKSGRHL